MANKEFQNGQMKAEDNTEDNIPENLREEIKKLKPDSKGLYTLKFNKPSPSYSKKDVENDFGHFGAVEDIHFTDKPGTTTVVFVRYKKKSEAEKAILLMSDTYNIQVPSVSKGWNKGKDVDEISEKISRLTPDSRGWYSMRIEKPNPKFNEKDVEASFGKYGEISNIHFTDKFIYIRYLTWKEASNAIKGLDSQFKLDVPSVSNNWKPQRSHADKGPQIYIGNISPRASRETIVELLEKFKPKDFSFYSINNRTFAFAFFESIHECKEVISDLNGKMIRGLPLHVRICRDRSRARYIAEDDYKISKEGKNRRKPRGDFDKMSPFGQGFVELYISNFGWKVTKPQLEQLFMANGQVAYVEVVNIKEHSGECRKAYVGMYDAYEAKQTVHKLNQRKWNGLTLNVAFSTRKPKIETGMMQGSVNNKEYDHNPVDRALTISHKLDVMLNEVLDKCDFCNKIQVMMSELQQAMREIKYQTLRGEVAQGISLLGELINQVEQEANAKEREQLRYHNQASLERDVYGNGQQMMGSMYDNQPFMSDREREIQRFREGGMPEPYYGGGMQGGSMMSGGAMMSRGGMMDGPMMSSGAQDDMMIGGMMGAGNMYRGDMMQQGRRAGTGRGILGAYSGLMNQPTRVGGRGRGK